MQYVLLATDGSSGAERAAELAALRSDGPGATPGLELPSSQTATLTPARKRTISRPLRYGR
jgi:hypothetical protein